MIGVIPISNPRLFASAQLNRHMNPYEIVKDAVLKTEGMSVKAFVILVLGLTLLFTLLI